MRCLDESAWVECMDGSAWVEMLEWRYMGGSDGSA